MCLSKSIGETGLFPPGASPSRYLPRKTRALPATKRMSHMIRRRRGIQAVLALMLMLAPRVVTAADKKPAYVATSPAASDGKLKLPSGSAAIKRIVLEPGTILL